MEKKMEATIGYWEDNGKENGNYRDYREYMGFYMGINGKENGSYYRILGLYKDNGKENGSYYRILGLYKDNGKENGNY